MTINQIKRYLRHALPQPLFRLIQRVRTIGHQPSQEVVELQSSYERRQSRASGPDEIIMTDEISLKISPESREPFEWFCCRHPEMVRELEAFIQRSRGAHTFLDIGANHGIFSLVFLKLNPGGRTVSIDPSPIAGRIRNENRHLNDFEHSMASYEVACGAEEGTVHMHFNWHHLEITPDSANKQDNVEVRVETADAICAREHLAPEVVKIDVEGYEFEVLKGAQHVLNHARILFLEIHPEILEQLNVPQIEIYQWLADRDWKCTDLSGQTMTSSAFADRIHTFWTLWVK